MSVNACNYAVYEPIGDNIILAVKKGVKRCVI